MRRWIITIPIFLLAGAVVNVAVTWGCALWIPASGPTLNYVEHRDASLRELEADGRCRYWAIERFSRSGAVFYYSYYKAGLDCDEITSGSTDLRPSELAPPWAGLRTPPTTDYVIRDAHAYGWPLVSMWQDYSYDVYAGDGYNTDLVHGVALAFLSPDGGFPRAVPLCPIWPGFAVNTVFCVLVVWLVIRGPFALRRLIRRRRDLCPVCAYPMGEGAICTECGRPLPQRAVV